VIFSDGSRAGQARSRLSRRTGGLAAVVLVGAAALLVTESRAAADPPKLSAVFLSYSLPDFFADPPGATNGPIDGSSLKTLEVSDSAASALGQQIADGNVKGYIRTWRHEPLDGDGVVISAFSFHNPADLSEFTEGEATAAVRARGVRFAVPGVSKASGYTVKEAGTSAFVVTLTRAGIAFQVDVLDASHQLTASDAVSLARRQAEAVPAAFQAPAAAVQGAGAKGPHPGGSPTDRDGELVGGSLLAVLLAAGLVLTRRRRRSRNRVSASPKAGADSPAGSGGKTSPAEPSWLPHPSRRIGETWVDAPAVDSLPEDRRRAHIELEVCVWQGVGSRSDRLADPSEEDVEAAIRKLDGSTRNDLYLRAPGGQWMGVAGGPERVIVTFAGGDEGPFYQAVTSSHEDDEDVQIRVGGQPVRVAARTLVSGADAAVAAIEFVRTGERPSSLVWTP